MAENNIPGLSEQAIKIATDNAIALDNIFKTAPKTYEEAQFRKAQIDRGGYTPPTLMQMGGVTEEQVEANMKAQKEAKEKADAEAQEAEEAKHRKAEKMWSAIGDGISAIANMATVGAGADSMYNPADSLHAKVKSKWDEIKANKAAVAAANRKAQMDLLLKEYELGVKSKEAEANRNFNIWKVGTEEEGKNRRAKEDQEFRASEKQKDRDNDKEVAKIRGKYSRSSGGGSSSEPKFYATNPNGGRHTWKSPQQGVGEMMRWMQANGYKDNIPTKGLWEDIDTRYANVYAAYEDAVADWQSKQSNDNQIDLSGL